MKSRTKLIFLFFFSLLFFIRGIFGQQANRYGIGLTSDPKWYVLDGKTNDLDDEAGANNISNKITLENIGAPNQNSREELHDDRARDDVFVIFNDGDHYNSRPAHSYNPERFSLLPQTGRQYNFKYYNQHLSFRFSENLNIDYLYLTDVYDEDPPPRRVSIHGGLIIERGEDLIPLENENVIPDNLLGTNSILSANHDITLNSDLVIIINKDSLKGTRYLLKYSTIKYPNNDRNLNRVVLTPKKIFNNASDFSLYATNVDSDLESGEFSFKGNDNNETHYIYLALEPIIREIQNYLPGKLNQVKKVVFKLYEFDEKSTEFELIATLEEEIHAAHDPNGLYATQVCRDTDNNEYVRYFLQFQNTSTDAISEYSAKFTLPKVLDAQSIHIVASSVGSMNKNPAISTTDQGVVTFKWQEATIKSKNIDKSTVDDTESIVTVEFCVKKKNEPINLMETSLLATNAHTFFGTQEFDLRTEEGDKTKTCNATKEGSDSTYYHYCSREFENCNDCSVKSATKTNLCKRLRDFFRKKKRNKK